MANRAADARWPAHRLGDQLPRGDPDGTGRAAPEETARPAEATLEATADGILVVDLQRRVAGTNREFQQLWGIPDELIATEDDARLLDYVLEQLTDPQAFIDECVYLSSESSFSRVLRAHG